MIRLVHRRVRENTCRRMQVATKRLLTGIALLAVTVSAGCGSKPPRTKTPALNLTPDGGQAGLDEILVEELTDSSVTAFVLGPQGEIQAGDFRPLMSSGEAYYEKWEMRVNAEPFDVRAQFEVASLGFGDFKGRVKGYVKRSVNGAEPEIYKFDKKLAKSAWSYAKDGFRLEMGPVVLEGGPDHFTLTGSTGGKNSAEFAFDIDGESWRPGSGVVAFGDEGIDYYRSQLLVVQGTAKGTVKIGDAAYEAQGWAYGNHLASNLGIHEMAERTYYYRRHDEDLFVEWRMNVTTDAFEEQPFGYLVVAYKGVVVFESWDLIIQPHEYWVDEAGAGYRIERGLTIVANQGDDQAKLSLKADNVEVRDPLKNLPPLERAVAEQFAKPMDYKIPGPWRLDLTVGGTRATAEGTGSYNVTVFN